MPCYTLSMIQEEIKGEIKNAMLAKDLVKLETMRALSAAFTNELVAKGRKPQETLTDEECLAVLARIAKQRKEAITQFRAGGREDLAAEDEAQLAIIETYLPKQMSEEEVRTFVTEKISSMGGEYDKGKLIGMIMKDLKGKADGSLVKQVVENL
jgi:uncharacterized protein YqeY